MPTTHGSLTSSTRQNEDSRLTGAREEGTAYAKTRLKVLDRQECRLDTKYGKVFTKTKNVPIIMIAKNEFNKVSRAAQSKVHSGPILLRNHRDRRGKAHCYSLGMCTEESYSGLRRILPNPSGYQNGLQ